MCLVTKGFLPTSVFVLLLLLSLLSLGFSCTSLVREFPSVFPEQDPNHVHRPLTRTEIKQQEETPKDLGKTGDPIAPESSGGKAERGLFP